MVADTKKVQTLINRMADVVEVGRSAEAIKDAYVAANPDVIPAADIPATVPPTDIAAIDPPTPATTPPVVPIYSESVSFSFSLILEYLLLPIATKPASRSINSVVGSILPLSILYIVDSIIVQLTHP